MRGSIHFFDISSAFFTVDLISTRISCSSGGEFLCPAGETFGVIGPNGCGKSTLPQGSLQECSIQIAAESKSMEDSSILELGSGFQSELTARDNVYLYGAVMGLTKRDIDRRYEDIMDFAELKRFENMKLRSFSSGMVVRLAFATAIQTDPDIMLVDEVLAVGDEAFQQKCSQKIDQIRSSGKTILWSLMTWI